MSTRMQPDLREEQVAGLLLDEANPRFSEHASSQLDAINRLIEDAPAKLMRLGEDIVAEGAVNPSELPMVLEDSDELVVIEGNRRLAALKLLRNPRLARHDTVRAKFEELSKLGVGPDTLWIVPVQTREEAKHWIDLRHTGENGGVGVVEWAAWQANNFRRRRGTQADRAALFCDAVAADFPDDDDLQDLISQVRSSKLTTLGRLVSDPEVRRDVGFDFVDDAVVFHYSSDALINAVRRIFGDLAGKVSVTDIKTKADRKKYIQDRSSGLPDRAMKLPEPRAPGVGGSQDSESSKGVEGKKDKKDKKKPPKPDRVIFEGLKLKNLGPRISNVLMQAQKVDIDTAPAVCAAMIRVILDIVVTASTTELKLRPSDTKLKNQVRACLLRLDPECANSVKRDKTLEAAWVRTQESDGFAVQSMHSFIHNPKNDPMPSEVRSLSHTFLPVLQRLDDAVGSANP